MDEAKPIVHTPGINWKSRKKKELIAPAQALISQGFFDYSFFSQ
jgi:hypothetical protein